MKCPMCEANMREEHDRSYDGRQVQFVYFWKCRKCCYTNDESGGFNEY